MVFFLITMGVMSMVFLLEKQLISLLNICNHGPDLFVRHKRRRRSWGSRWLGAPPVPVTLVLGRDSIHIRNIVKIM